MNYLELHRVARIALDQSANHAQVTQAQTPPRCGVLWTLAISALVVLASTLVVFPGVLYLA